jgi:2-iminobutanoate/2-iminopropanoate deaminase
VGYTSAHSIFSGKLMRSVVTALLLAISLCGLIGEASAETRTYVDPGSPSNDSPAYSGAVRIGDTLYLAGAIGLTEDDQVPDDPKEEARLLMEQYKTRLAKAGYTMDDLVTVTVYCSDVKYYADFNEVYRQYFKENFPARAFIGAGTLLFNARFEMQGIAIKREE